MSSDDRSVPASARRIAQARAHGAAAISSVAVGTAAILSAAVALPATIHSTRAAFEAALARALTHNVGGVSLAAAARSALADAIRPVVTTLVAASLAAAVTGAMQTGFLFAPRSGPRRRAARKGLAAAFLEVACGVLVVAVGFVTIRSAWNTFAIAGVRSPSDVVADLAHGLRAVLGAGIATCVAIAVFDVIRARVQFAHALRMSPAEARRDARESEGDPHVRAARARAAREAVEALASRDAYLLLVHDGARRAVALAWDPTRMSAPTVVDVVSYATAASWIQRADRVVRDESLASDLARLPPGREIPERLYETVAPRVGPPRT